MKYMGQIMAECDCQTEETCMAAGRCIAEKAVGEGNEMTKPAALTNEQLAAELLEPLPHYALLDWMTYHHLPLELFREEETEMWVVCDTSRGTVIGSGETTTDALVEARLKELT